MNWFRSNIKSGARLALCALLLQLALSFGHFHGIAARATPTVDNSLTSIAADGYSDAVATTGGQATSPWQSTPSGDHDQQPADPCAICAVVAMAGTVLLATPPLLPLPQAFARLERATDAEFTRLPSAVAAFQPRAPPAA
jgi:hypothetical protein